MKRFLSATFVLIITATMLTTIISTANAQIPTRDTTAYISINPHLVGLGQEITVNLWIYPSPATLSYSWLAEAFTNLTATFTRPDGTKDIFMPVGGSGGVPPGTTYMVGDLWFLYKPNQIGTWTVQFSFPGQTLGPSNDAVYYKPATSQTITFTVQKDLVQIGLPPVPLPTGYWTRPINSNNREWSQISGSWPQTGYSGTGLYGTQFNPYSKAPNTGHILWTQQVSQGGIIGGDWGSLSYGAAGGTPGVIIMGRVYYNMPGGVFDCVDLRTGKLLYEKPGTITLAQNLRPLSRDPNTPETQGAQVAAHLWGLESTAWKRYDPLNGALMQTITGVPAPAPTQFGVAGVFTTYWFEGDPVVYIIRQSGWNTTIPRRLTDNELIKWDYNKVTGNNWTTGIVWRVSMKQPDGTGPGEGARGSGLLISGDAGFVFSTGEDTFYGFDLTTGAQTWTKKIGYQNMLSYVLGPDGTTIGWDSATRRIHCHDIKTGNELWVTDPFSYPWGSNMRYPAWAYGNIYVPFYDGYIYCLDSTTGKTKWKFYCGSTTETIFGNWEPYVCPWVADGKIYIGTSEHTPTQPRIRGNKLFCIDAYTGKGIWNISGAMGMSTRAIAEGLMVVNCENDGLLYCFGKGETATTVSAPQTTVTRGTSILISGTVMDMSPAQPNTPAIADKYMSEWMNYLHAQTPTPMTSADDNNWGTPVTVTGVPILLTATAPDGSTINIGETTSNGYGNFAYDWTPPNVGIYYIQATFLGSESYWSSTAETAVSVKVAPVSPQPTATAPAGTSAPSTPTPTPTAPTTSPTLAPTQPASPSPTVAPPPAEEAPPMTLYIVIALAAVVIVVIAAVALVLRRRAK